MSKPPPHPDGGRHKWQHVRDVELSTMKVTPHGRTGTIKFRALYKCGCGATKVGSRL